LIKPLVVKELLGLVGGLLDSDADTGDTEG
jgi:hypothetical protein